MLPAPEGKELTPTYRVRTPPPCGNQKSTTLLLGGVAARNIELGGSSISSSTTTSTSYLADNSAMNSTNTEEPLQGISQSLWHYAFITIAIIGIVGNLFILWRKKATRKKTSTTTKTSLFLLSSMAAADTACLLALLCMLSQRYFQIKHPFFLNMVCKLDLFVIHSTSAFSIWCWLVLSAVRYVAVYRPYTHMRLSKEPRFAAGLLAAICGVLEAWVLYDIHYDPTSKACMSSIDESLSKKLQVAEIIVSYFLPVAIITALDLKVLLSRAIWYRGHSDAMSLTTREVGDVTDDSAKMAQNAELSRFGSFESSINSRKQSNHKKSSVGFSVGTLHSRSRKRAQQIKVLRRCLLITIFDLSMNLPNYLLRLYLTVISQEEYVSLNMEVIGYVENVSQVLYFAQFALNALYLVCIIYDNPKKKESKILVSTQVSSACSPRPMSERKSFRFGAETPNNLMI